MAVDKLNKVLSDKPSVNKKMKAKLRYVTKNYPGKRAQYERQEATLGDRNSYSKTDPDATFIVNYTVHPNPTDTRTLSGHLEQHEESFGAPPKTLTADAGYGSEENYALLAGKNTESYVKYSMFDKVQKKNHGDRKPFSVDKRSLLYHLPPLFKPYLGRD